LVTVAKSLGSELVWLDLSGSASREREISVRPHSRREPTSEKKKKERTLGSKKDEKAADEEPRRSCSANRSQNRKTMNLST
jgi:hypothetical protein